MTNRLVMRPAFILDLSAKRIWATSAIKMSKPHADLNIIMAMYCVIPHQFSSLIKA